jgi:hypothetical protein
MTVALMGRSYRGKYSRFLEGARSKRRVLFASPSELRTLKFLEPWLSAVPARTEVAPMLSPPTKVERRAGKSAQRQLDVLVVSVELTLVSIIQGVALYFLAESSRTPLGDLRFDQWPYVANGLMLILIFWSRSVAHAFTLIRWPLELVHNSLYIACTLIEAMVFINLTDPLRWYAFNAAFAILCASVFVIDLRRMIRQRQSEAAEPAEEELYGVIIRDHYKNILLLMPGMTLLNLTAVGGICFWPEVWIRGGGHVVFATIQTIALLGYLIYVFRFFATTAPMILRANQEEGAR